MTTSSADRAATAGATGLPQASRAKCKPLGGRPWQAMVTGLALTIGLGASSFAATAPSLQGRWIMAPAQSSFEESVTGPRPDALTMVVTRDDPGHLTYELMESQGGEQVAHGRYDLSFSGAGSVSSVDGERVQVVAEREPAGDVVVLGPRVAGAQGAIRMRLTGPDTALLEHDVTSGGTTHRLETISLVRAEAVAAR